MSERERERIERGKRERGRGREREGESVTRIHCTDHLRLDPTSIAHLIPGIYDTHIHIRGAPLLEESGLTPSHRMITEKISIGEVAKKDLVVLPSKIQVKSLVEILKNCQHNSFPIINGQEKTKMVIEGSISRPVLYKMMEHRMGLFDNPEAAPGEGEESGEQAGGAEENGAASAGGLETKYGLPRDQRRRRGLQSKLEPRIDGDPLDLDLIEFDLNKDHLLESNVYIDLAPFMQQNPFVLSPETSLSRAYHLFRTMGLRYLFVGHTQPVVSGIITRKDLSESAIKLSIGKKVRRRFREGDRRDDSEGEEMEEK